MKHERRYKIYAMNNKEYVIDEEDLQKLKKNAGEMLVQLKTCIVHPSSISVIEPTFEPYTQRYKEIAVEVDGKNGKQRSFRQVPDGEPKPPEPIQDLFTNTYQPNYVKIQFKN